MSFFSYISAYFFVINEFNGNSCIKDMHILNDFLIYAAKRPFLKKVYQLNSHEKYIWENALIEITLKATWSEVKVTQLCPTLCDPMNRSTPGLPVHHHLLEFTQTHVHWVSDAIQPSHPLSSPFPPALNPSQHQGVFQWVSSLHQMAKVLEFQLYHHSF